MGDASVNLARMVVTTGYPDLPGQVVEATKLDILDTLATLVAGSGSPGCREVVDLISQWGGREEATVLVYGTKAPSVWAALANTTMAHALDYDDTHDKAVMHAGVVVIPSALAVAEGRRVSGKEFIAAVALGVDVACRLALAAPLSPIQSGWMHSPLYGHFASAAAAGKILQLDEESLINAFGIAYAQAAGNMQCIADAALTKRIQPGFAAQDGIMAVLMSQSGITGARNSLEGEAGLYKVYYQGDYDPLPLTQALGQDFEIVNLSFKPYPSCRYTHPFIDAALQLAKEHDLNAEDIKNITVYVGQSPHPICEPLEVKCNPRTIVDAQFSIPYTVAVALVKRKVGIADFTPEAITHSEVIQVANKVTPKLDTRLSSRVITPAIIEVELYDGKRYRAEVEYPKGHPQNPLSMEDISDKLKDGISYAAKLISTQQIEDVIQIIKHLDEVDDVSVIAKLLS